MPKPFYSHDYCERIVYDKFGNKKVYDRIWLTLDGKRATERILVLNLGHKKKYYLYYGRDLKQNSAWLIKDKKEKEIGFDNLMLDDFRKIMMKSDKLSRRDRHKIPDE